MHNYYMDLQRLFGSGSESEIRQELQHRLNGLPIDRISSIETHTKIHMMTRFQPWLRAE